MLDTHDVGAVTWGVMWFFLVYEAKGVSYENQDGSKNEPKKGAPEPKDKAKKEAAKKPGKV